MSYALDMALSEVQRLREIIAAERAEFQKRIDDASAEICRLRSVPAVVETKTVFKNVTVTTVMPPKLVHIERQVEVPVTIEKVVEKVVRVPVTIEKVVEKLNTVTKTEHLPCDKCSDLSDRYDKLKQKFAEIVEKNNGGN